MRHGSVLAGAALLFAACATHATVIDIDLRKTTLETTAGPLFFDQGGLVLTLTQEPAGSLLLRDVNGLGIKLASGSDGSEIDLLGPDEALSLEFSEPVRLLTFLFAQVGSNDDFRLTTGSSELTAALPGGNNSDTALSLFDLGPYTLQGTIFTLAPASAFSEFSLARISLTHALPTPPAWLLMLAPLPWLAAAAVRHRRRKPDTQRL